ncbi:uncharacterized protein [Triticum aestivum]|uniref:uncharacterized protein isoform X1 n=1 Tax=Triticum aestivum TaxID=4565 RepID=UPI001D023FF5|nr:uncharacterized protein LOC123070426 isoform X1 [Triticum aestivum]
MPQPHISRRHTAPASQLLPSRRALTYRRSNRHEEEAIVTPSPLSMATSRRRARTPITTSTPVSRRCKPPLVAASNARWCGNLPAPSSGSLDWSWYMIYLKLEFVAKQVWEWIF